MGEPARVMLDPSFLFASDGLTWLAEQPGARDSAVVPATLSAWLRGEVDIDPAAVLADDDLEAYGQQRDRLIGVLDGLPTFSHEEVGLPDALDQVRFGLLDLDAAVGQMRADEWAFLQSSSTLMSKVRHPLEAFRDAGAVIVEVGRRAGRQLLSRVIPKEHLPAALDAGVLARAAGKWIVLGGATIGGGTLGGLAGTAIAGPAGAWVGGKAGGFAAGAAANAVVLAIDP
jgi:hypothetical protein